MTDQYAEAVRARGPLDGEPECRMCFDSGVAWLDRSPCPCGRPVASEGGERP